MNAIHVTFIDASSNRVIAETNMPPEQLPESFALPTTLHLGSDDWDVEEADPSERAGYVSSGRLRLVVRKIETMDPSQILFSLPTLEDALPPLREGDGTGALALHEDDWRQHEFVSGRLRPEIEAELEQIRTIHSQQVGIGYERVHVRSRIPQPLAGIELPVSVVGTALGQSKWSGVTVGGALVVDGIAFATHGGAVYGRTEQGRAVVLALAGDPDPAPLRALAMEYDLVLVDWLRAEIS